MSSNNNFPTIPDADDYVHTVCGFMKVPEEYQMGMKVQIIVCMVLRKVEVPTAMWLMLDEAIERLILATLSVAELQEVVSVTLGTKYIPATSIMPITTVPVFIPVLQ